MKTEAKRKFLIDIAFLLVIVAIIYLVFKFLSVYLLPFVIGIFVSFIVQKPVGFVSRKTKIPRNITTVLFVVITYLLILGVLTLLGFGLYNWLYSLLKLIPGLKGPIMGAISTVSSYLSDMLKNVPDSLLSSLNGIPTKAIDTITGAITSNLPKIALSVAEAAPSLIVSTIVTIVASCYIASDYINVVGYIKKHSPTKVWDIIVEIKNLFTKTIFKLLRGYILLMLITFAELCIGLGLIGQSNFIMLAAIICIVDILPVLGTGTVVIPWGIIALLTGNFWKCILLLLLYIVITVVRNFLEPKVIGEQVGLHPLVTLIAIFSGYRLIGFFGIFLFPITLIILYDLYKSGKITIFNSEEN